ncbi:hypothetical protein RchiOBHm_Chr7g0216491 [Rosa chinensis]|uniref:DUF4220 domain-containing protein n=1 Tax=Rosa chinensis TaxID=74649 RepID=A0A2P6PBR6_ROSCH|nr:hypothetical protein RchiOBHm_Chr7g0216491 [Rosa chinensis]
MESLLLHTAYSMENTELWLTHLLDFVVQVGLAFYVFIWIASTYHLLLVIPVFVAGVIKYGERTWVLQSTSSKKLADSLLLPSYPRNNCANFEEKYSTIKA